VSIQGGNAYLQGLLFSGFFRWSDLSMRCFHLFHGRWTRLSIAAGVLATVASMAAPSFAAVVSFGSGGNTFNMEFVTIGNAGNAPDTTGSPNPAGAVGYEYGLGKFEVSEEMIEKFNASQSLQITKDTRGTAKPATNVSWNEAARFVNWLNTSTGGFAAYNFTTSGVNDNIAVWTAADTADTMQPIPTAASERRMCYPATTSGTRRLITTQLTAPTTTTPTVATRLRRRSQVAI